MRESERDRTRPELCGHRSVLYAPNPDLLSPDTIVEMYAVKEVLSPRERRYVDRMLKRNQTREQIGASRIEPLTQRRAAVDTFQLPVSPLCTLMWFVCTQWMQSIAARAWALAATSTTRTSLSRSLDRRATLSTSIPLREVACCPRPISIPRRCTHTGWGWERGQAARGEPPPSGG